MYFTAIDVETANESLNSICQIGLVVIEDGHQRDAWSQLVNPGVEFSPANICIHGITPQRVAGEKTFAEHFKTLRSYIGGGVVVCHTAFDRVSINRACQQDGCHELACRWLDTAKVVRRTWHECAYANYGLKAVAAMLSIDFRHHDAVEDARVCGEILLRATSETGRSIEDWFTRVSEPISDTRASAKCADPLARDGNPEGLLAGESIVFTGSMSIPRKVAADMAAAAGCCVSDGPNRTTTMLVVGDQDITRLVGHEKSSKHRKAESMIERGQKIRIMTEGDFQRLIAVDQN